MPSIAEVLDGVCEFMRAVEARSFKRLAGQNAEPDFDLIEPRRRGWSKVECDVWMRFKPIVVLLVSAVVVDNGVNFLLRGHVFKNIIHEGLEVSPGLGC